MKTRVKQIPRPSIQGLTFLTPAELNSLRLSDKSTVLTPGMLEKKNPKSSSTD